MSSQKMVRYTMELTVQDHMALKLMAVKKGISMRDMFLEGVGLKEKTMKDSKYTSEESFEAALKTIEKQYSEMAKRLAHR